MATRPSDAEIKLRLANIIADAEDRLFERFDALHMKEIHDNDVIGYLRGEGLDMIAKRYIEWSGALDPDEDNTTTSPVVPDPVPAASYAELFAADGIDDSNLLEVMQQVVSRDGKRHQIEALEKEYHGRFLTDPVFHARCRQVGNFLDTLEDLHQAGDTERVGFLIVALMDRLFGEVRG